MNKVGRSFALRTRISILNREQFVTKLFVELQSAPTLRMQQQRDHTLMCKWKLAPATLLSAVIALMLIGCGSTGSNKAESELEMRARSGDIEAEYQLGQQYANSTSPRTPEAIYWLCRAAKEGHVPAQLELAMLYARDVGTGNNAAADGHRLSDRGSAYFWYTAAASQGNDQALASRDDLAANMDAKEVMEVKRKATRWQQAVCVEP